MGSPFYITAKATSEETILDKKKKGADSIEYQIMEGNADIDVRVADILPITSVHTCLIDGVDVSLDYCFDTDYASGAEKALNRKKFEEALDLADNFGYYQGKMVKVVVHLHNKVQGVSYKQIASQFKWWLDRYPNVIIAVENNTLMNRFDDIRTAAECGAVPNFVKQVRRRLPVEYGRSIGTVLDTCHVMGTLRIMRLIHEFNGLPTTSSEISGIEEYFQANKDICKIIHLNNAVGQGLIGKNHGTIFKTEEDKKLLIKLLQFYRYYTNDADLVLEIRENDYSDAINFEYTVKQLRYLESRL